MVLITIVSLSSSSNKLDNNFNCDTNLLMTMPSLLISNEKVLPCNCLDTNNRRRRIYKEEEKFAKLVREKYPLLQ